MIMDMDIQGLNICKIKVIGVGGAGNNAVNRMIGLNITSAQFASVNTDKQALMLSSVPIENRITIGEGLTKGLGAGSDPEVGEKAAEESREQLEKLVDGVDLLFIAAGMGGGTGTGAAPVIAKMAKEKGCVTVAVVTKPFAFEGRRREENAKKGIANLAKYVDTIIIIPNDKLLEALPGDISMLDALKVADDNLRQGICGISDLINTPALINLDFADVRTIIQNQGLAHMGVGRAKGENRVIEAVRQAVSSPLLETTIEGAKGVILNITGGKDLTLGQVYEAAGLVKGVVDHSANIIFGANISEELQEEIEITVIATGFINKENAERSNSEAQSKKAFADLMREQPKNSQQPQQSVNHGQLNGFGQSMNQNQAPVYAQQAQFGQTQNYQQHQQINGYSDRAVQNGYAEQRTVQNNVYNERQQNVPQYDYQNGYRREDNRQAQPQRPVAREDEMRYQQQNYRNEQFRGQSYQEQHQEERAERVDGVQTSGEQGKKEIPTFMKKLFGKK